jgi:hypothetical protein
MKMSIPTSGLKDYVQHLAIVNGITYRRTEGDAFAEAATRLADDTVISDDIEDIIVELKRSHVIDSKTMVELLGNYLDELRHV